MVCDASKSSFSAGLRVLIMKAIFWTSYREILNPITTQKMAILQNPVRRLQMIIFSWCYGVCHKSGNLQPICKIIVFSWPYSLSSKRHFGDLTEKFPLKPHYESKDGQFSNYRRMPLNHPFLGTVMVLIIQRHFGALTAKILT